MSRKRGNKAVGFVIAGIILCVVCVVCLAAVIISIVGSLGEKNRLEALGAVVSLKPTWMFFVSAGAGLLTGIIGMMMLKKSKGYRNVEPIREVSPKPKPIPKPIPKPEPVSDLDPEPDPDPTPSPPTPKPKPESNSDNGFFYEADDL